MRKRNSHWIICRHCRGEGKSSGYLGAFSMAELHEDPDFYEDYMSGAYDRPCEVCAGSGKLLVKEPDPSHLNDDEIEEGDDPCDCRACRDERIAWARESATERRAEYLMSGAWRYDRDIPTVSDFLTVDARRLEG